MHTVIGKFYSIKISICYLIKCEIYILTRYVAYKTEAVIVLFDKCWCEILYFVYFFPGRYNSKTAFLKLIND